METSSGRSRRRLMHLGDEAWGVLLLVLLCLLSVAALLRASIVSGWEGNGFEIRRKSYYVTHFENRFTCVRPILPQAGIVGYLTDGNVNVPGKPRMRYRILQFDLAPLIVEDGKNHPFVVGNFPAGQLNWKNGEFQQLRLLRSCGGGALLFRSDVR